MPNYFWNMLKTHWELKEEEGIKYMGVLRPSKGRHERIVSDRHGHPVYQEFLEKKKKRVLGFKFLGLE